MKVLVIGPAHPYRGGIADTNESLANAFQKAGHDTTLITFKVQYPGFLFPGKSQFSDSKAPENLKIIRMIHSMNPLNWIASGLRIRKMKPDLIVIRFWLPFIAVSLGTVARLQRKNTEIVGMVDNAIPHEKRLGDGWFTAYFFGACNRFMALSGKVANDIKTLSKKPVSSYPHPINDQLPPTCPKDQARKQLKLVPDAKVILFFGFIRKYKGLDILIDALADQRLRDLQVQLVIAGEFYEPQEPYLEQIERLGLKDTVQLHSEFIPMEEVPIYFGASDAVVQTYRNATQSGITQMALHFERPVVVTDVGSMRELVEEGVSGLLCEPKASSVADTLVKYFTTFEANTFEQNLPKQRAKYSWDAFVSHLLSKG